MSTLPPPRIAAAVIAGCQDLRQVLWILDEERSHPEGRADLVELLERRRDQLAGRLVAATPGRPAYRLSLGNLLAALACELCTAPPRSPT